MYLEHTAGLRAPKPGLISTLCLLSSGFSTSPAPFPDHPAPDVLGGGRGFRGRCPKRRAWSQTQLGDGMEHREQRSGRRGYCKDEKGKERRRRESGKRKQMMKARARGSAGAHSGARGAGRRARGSQRRPSLVPRCAPPDPKGSAPPTNLTCTKPAPQGPLPGRWGLIHFLTN